MEIKDFEFDLPEELIAQYPLGERDLSRLMVLSRATGSFLHRSFREIHDFFVPGDVLILNNTKVIPTRLIGTKASGGKIELLLVEKLGINGQDEEWSCLIRNSKGLKKGSRLFFDKGVEAEVAASPSSDGLWVSRFNGSPKLEEIGKVPLPPYIRREADSGDKARYQTVFAGREGAVAAPTAGLHFTDELIKIIREKGIEVHFITLHTGPGTFMPVRVDDITRHRMLNEKYDIGVDAFNAVKSAKKEGRRVIAVGTTSTRALEAAARDFESPVLSGATDLFIYPGYKFKVIDGLLTNFHLPGSTLIMLVSAFAGLDNLLNAYREAVREKYRFFSYGDAMLVI
ncbi:MAG: tRNA preQ1(34) S-adenosylmethionine ribosyltransferase-isomerase QueA [Deltaproteobacteria bacterium]|nr:tRNA preQ1(34) S-adenosylmethionine ribosyltransferase-isomerase QueA [Deltaproteobacteria bacterium]